MRKGRRFIEVCGTVTKKSAHVAPPPWGEYADDQDEYRVWVSDIEFDVGSKESYDAVREGDEVVVGLGHRVRIRRGTSSTAQQLSTLNLQFTQREADAIVQGLRGLEIPASTLERDPLSAQANGWNKEDAFPSQWIEIAEGPVRWIRVPRLSRPYPFGNEYKLQKWGYCCYVPDSRITTDSPRVSIISVHVRSFPLFGGFRGVRWEMDWVGIPHHVRDRQTPEIDKDFNSLVAHLLAQDTVVGARLLSATKEIHVSMDRGRGCWLLFVGSPHVERKSCWDIERGLPELKDFPLDHGWFDRTLWDCCGAVAQSLLAMPIARSE